jgi:hypothetical protein
MPLTFGKQTKVNKAQAPHNLSEVLFSEINFYIVFFVFHWLFSFFCDPLFFFYWYVDVQREMAGNPSLGITRYHKIQSI